MEHENLAFKIVMADGPDTEILARAASLDIAAAARLTEITTSVVDELYGKLLVVKEVDADGNVIERERRTTINHAMKTCRRAWNIAFRRNPSKVPHINPFSGMGLKSSDRETPTATFE